MPSALLLQVPSKKVQKPSPASRWKERTDQAKKEKKKKDKKTISTPGSLRHRQVAVSVSPTPETPECCWGPDPSWGAWKRAGFCLPLRGLSQLLPRSSAKGGPRVRGRGLQTPKAPAKRAGLQCSGYPAPSGCGRGNPARPPPSAHGPCRAAGPGRAPRRDSAGYTWCRRRGPRPPSCSSVSSSTAARSEAGPYGELGRRRPGRGLLLLPLPLPRAHQGLVRSPGPCGRRRLPPPPLPPQPTK